MSDPRPELGFLEGRTLRDVTRGDAARMLALLALACATVVAGRHAARALSPLSTPDLASMLDDLETPARLPDAPLTGLDGNTVSLRQRIDGPNAVVAFYASWCGPCQRELPLLVKDLGPLAPVFVVIGPDEDLDDTRRQIANLGVDVTLLVDGTGALGRGAKVTALPATFLITRDGAVLLASRGFSWLGLFRMKQRLSPDGADVPDFGVP